MNIWKILGIKRTNNTKEIKQAYAKKLKVTRPDEHPEEFQQLHIAYKRAIDQSKHQWEAAESTDDAQPDTIYDDNQENSLQDIDVNEEESLVIPNVAIQKNEAHALKEKYQIEINRLVERSQNILNAEAQLNDIEAWCFLMDSPYILDLDFNWELGLAILQLLGEHNEKIYTHQIKADLMSYLNNIFSWDANKDYIAILLCSDVISDLLNNISDAYNNKNLSGLRGSASIKYKEPNIQQLPDIQHATVVTRFFAFAVDAFILTSLFFLANLTPLFDTGSIDVGYLAALLLLISTAYFFFFEVSSLHASPGKIALGLIVANQQYEPISIIQALLRTGLVFVGIAIFVALVFYASSGVHLGISLGLCIVTLRIIIFICSNPEEKILLNDLFSKTFVFDLRKARREHLNQ